MTFTEFLIVYLSIGAPFGVYFFLNHRNGGFDRLLKAFVAAFLWCFYFAFLILRRSNKTTKASNLSDSDRENSNIEAASRKLLALYSEMPTSSKNIPFFDFRETIERYVGLTTALSDAAESSFYENEIFQISGRKKQELTLANACLQRKNLLRLKLHQQRARLDFIKIFETSADNAFRTNNDQKLLFAAICLTDEVADEEGKAILNRIKIEIEKQNSQNASSSVQEKEVWKTRKPEQITILPTQSSTFNLTVKTQD